MDSVLYGMADLLTSAVSSDTFRIVAALIVLGILANDVIRRRVTVVTLMFALAAVPLLTPLATTFSGAQFFTAMNYDLQRDEALVNAAVLLVLMFSLAFYVGAASRSDIVPVPQGAVPALPASVILVMAAVTLTMMALFLETETIIFASYQSIKSEVSPLSSTAQQLMNLTAAIALMSARSPLAVRVTKVFLLLALLIAILMSRRTMALSLITLFALMSVGSRLSVRQYIVLAIGLLLLLIIGEMRAVGIANFLNGARPDSLVRAYYSMPGGGANIFLAVMGMIHLNGTGNLVFPETMPILLWPSGVYESGIYEDFGYQYNGGMHIAAMLYWNFGILGVVGGGLGMGLLLGKMLKNGRLLRKGPVNILDGVLVLTIMLFPIFMWYSPVGFIKALAAFAFFVFLARIMPVRTRGHRGQPKSVGT